jgi:hypothetical protein
VLWTTQNGATTALTTSFISSSQLQAIVPSNLLSVGTAGTVSVTVTQPLNQGQVTSNTASFTITVPPGDLPLTATGKDITATVGVAGDFTVAQFTDADANAQPGNFAVPINWGDGTAVVAGRVTQPGGPGTPFFVDATHTYSSPGTFTVHVRIFDEAGAFAETFSTATVNSGVAPGGAARSRGGRQITVAPLGPEQQFQGEVFGANSSSGVAALLTDPTISGPSGRTSPAQDLYWQTLYQQRGGQLAGRNSWIADDLVLALQGSAS